MDDRRFSQMPTSSLTDHSWFILLVPFSFGVILSRYTEKFLTRFNGYCHIPKVSRPHFCDRGRTREKLMNSSLRGVELN